MPQKPPTSKPRPKYDPRPHAAKRLTDLADLLYPGQALCRIAADWKCPGHAGDPAQWPLDDLLQLDTALRVELAHREQVRAQNQHTFLAAASEEELSQLSEDFLR